MHTTTRAFLVAIAAAVLLAPLAGLHATETARPVLGAIRWDAWYGESGPVKHMEISLGPPKYHFRLPWFARVVGEGKVRINGDSQEILEREIAYAATAGLNYWAFVDYWDDANLSIALRRYRAAKEKRGVRYCFVEEGARLDAVGVRGWARLVEHFKDPNYQTVLDGRPLLFVFVKPQRLGKKEWQELGTAASAAGVKPPYLVLMGWQPEQDSKDMTALGFDAISAYAHGGSYSMKPPPYAQHCAAIQRDRWEKCRTLRVPSVTFASAGWDTRPRNERPPPWITWIGAGTPDNTPPGQQKPLIDAVTATPDQLAAHLQDAVNWTQRNRDINPSNAIIIYGWNENDEGGWLIPTLGPDGRPNEDRIKALNKVLRASPSPTLLP
ncbi:MAG: glycoside hydrolase family 99-like domain-containing protein [Pirellulales bacterium]